MPVLCLTYAWKDNEQNDVDFVVGRLQERGIEVRLDRTQLLAGKHLWEQIDQRLKEPDLDGWAIYVTQNSLSSEPCLEELAYALDRTLRTKGSSFPLIGIFPTPIDRELIPSAIATRLYVHLKDPEWSARVADALGGASTREVQKVSPIEVVFYEKEGLFLLEARPREGFWYPAMVLVPESEKDRLTYQTYKGPSRSPDFRPPSITQQETSGKNEAGVRWSGYKVMEQIDSTVSLYVRFKEWPSAIIVGGQKQLFQVDPKTNKWFEISVGKRS